MALSTSTTASSHRWRTTINDGKGSFRGVAFDVKGQQSQSGGRRVVKREFPLRENGGADDIGQRLNEYTFRAVLVGDDYLSRRDALIAALNAPGPGELVHPNYGTVQAQIDNWSCDEDTSSGGSAEFSITFLPPLTTTAPVSTADAAVKTAASATGAKAGLFGDFANGWSLEDLSLHDVTALIDSASAYVNSITSSIQQAFGVMDDLSDIMASASALQASLSALIYQPAALAHQFDNLVSSVDGIADSSGEAFNAYSSMSDNVGYNAASPEVIDTQDVDGNTAPQIVATPSSPAGKQALNQLTALVSQTITTHRTVAVSATLTESITLQNRQKSRTGRQMAELVADASVNFPALRIQSSDEARQITDSVAASLDSATYTSSAFGWSQAEDGFHRLRLIFMADMTARARLLPDLQTVTAPITEPALVLLNRVNGDVADLAAFTRRNNICNPLFLAAGDIFERVNS